MPERHSNSADFPHGHPQHPDPVSANLKRDQAFFSCLCNVSLSEEKSQRLKAATAPRSSTILAARLNPLEEPHKPTTEPTTPLREKAMAIQARRRREFVTSDCGSPSWTRFELWPQRRWHPWRSWRPAQLRRHRLNRREQAAGAHRQAQARDLPRRRLAARRVARELNHPAY